jgi:hypothetical protein
LVLASRFKGFAPNEERKGEDEEGQFDEEENVCGGFKATLTD